MTDYSQRPRWPSSWHRTRGTSLLGRPYPLGDRLSNYNIHLGSVIFDQRLQWETSPSFQRLSLVALVLGNAWGNATIDRLSLDGLGLQPCPGLKSTRPPVMGLSDRDVVTNVGRDVLNVAPLVRGVAKFFNQKMQAVTSPAMSSAIQAVHNPAK